MLKQNITKSRKGYENQQYPKKTISPWQYAKEVTNQLRKLAFFRMRLEMCKFVMTSYYLDITWLTGYSLWEGRYNTNTNWEDSHTT